MWGLVLTWTLRLRMARRGPSSPQAAHTTWLWTPPTSSSGHCCSALCSWGRSSSLAGRGPAQTLATLDIQDTPDISRDKTMAIRDTTDSADRQTMVRGVMFRDKRWPRDEAVNWSTKLSPWFYLIQPRYFGAIWSLKEWKLKGSVV